MQNPLNDPEPDEDECCHEDYEINILDGRATCSMCGFAWTATDKQMERHEELMREEDTERRYWDRVDQGRQQAKDRDIS